MFLSGCFLMCRSLMRWVAVFSLVFLVGCSSTSLIKTYDGPKVDASRSAVLSVSNGIDVVSVNGKEVEANLLPDEDLNYQMLPGENLVVFTHKTLWEKPGEREEGESSSVLVVTKPMQVSFNAKAGEVYSFIFSVPENRAEAPEFAKTFKATLVDSSEGFVAESTLYAKVSEAVTNKLAIIPAGVVATTSSTAKVDDSTLPAIDALKVLWGEASTAEKKEFLKWAFK